MYCPFSPVYYFIYPNEIVKHTMLNASFGAGVEECSLRYFVHSKSVPTGSKGIDLDLYILTQYSIHLSRKFI